MQLAVLLLNFRFELPSAFKTTSFFCLGPSNGKLRAGQKVTCQNKLFRWSEKLSPFKGVYLCCWGSRLPHRYDSSFSILREVTPLEGHKDTATRDSRQITKLHTHNYSPVLYFRLSLVQMSFCWVHLRQIRAITNPDGQKIENSRLKIGMIATININIIIIIIIIIVIIIIILLVVLHGSETWSLTMREKHWLRMFENGVLRKIFGPKTNEVIWDSKTA
jgi:hypothetical protein